MTCPSVLPPSNGNKSGPGRGRLPLLVIAVGLMVWGGFLALGAYLGISDQAPSHDPRRAWVMLISSGGFLLFWLFALMLRGRRLRRTSHRQQKPGQK